MSSSISPKRILLAEGTAELGSLFFDVLSRRGHAVVAVISLADGKKQLDSRPFDVLIASQKLSGAGEGNRLIAYASERYPEVKTILFSGHGRPEGCKADAFVPKPTKPEPLIAEVERPKDA